MTDFCAKLKAVIDSPHTPDVAKSVLEEIYEQHCGGGVHTNDDSGGNTPPPAPPPSSPPSGRDPG